jgi:hypothetical protein
MRIATRCGLVICAAYELYGAVISLDWRYAALGVTLLGFVAFSIFASRKCGGESES